MPEEPDRTVALQRIHDSFASGREAVAESMSKDPEMWALIKSTPILSSVCAAVTATIAADITTCLLDGMHPLDVAARLIAWGEPFGKNEAAVLSKIKELLDDDHC